MLTPTGRSLLGCSRELASKVVLFLEQAHFLFEAAHLMCVVAMSCVPSSLPQSVEVAGLLVMPYYLLDLIGMPT